jgi:hypothetical protein
VAALLAAERRRQRKGLKELVNEALREGLKHMNAPARSPRRFRTKSVNLGRCLVGSLDDVAEALAVAEGDSYE